jgi:hypothetical protein
MRRPGLNASWSDPEAIDRGWGRLDLSATGQVLTRRKDDPRGTEIDPAGNGAALPPLASGPRTPHGLYAVQAHPAHQAEGDASHVAESHRRIRIPLKCTVSGSLAIRTAQVM